MNFLALAQRVWVECGLSGSGPTAVTSQTGLQLYVVNWTADAWTEIQAAADWDFMRSQISFNTVNGQRTYDSNDDADIGTIRKWDYGYAKITSGSTIYPLVWLPWTVFRDSYEYQTQPTARPSFITVDPSGKLRFDTTPDAAYTVTLEGFENPTVLAATSDTPVIPSADHMVIVWRAVMTYASREAVPELYQFAQLNYNRAMNRLYSTSLQQISPQMVTLV